MRETEQSKVQEQSEFSKVTTCYDAQKDRREFLGHSKMNARHGPVRNMSHGALNYVSSLL
jgi:hypothetical protein